MAVWFLMILNGIMLALNVLVYVLRKKRLRQREIGQSQQQTLVLDESIRNDAKPAG